VTSRKVEAIKLLELAAGGGLKGESDIKNPDGYLSKAVRRMHSPNGAPANILKHLV